jgi:hypothetical protein
MTKEQKKKYEDTERLREIIKTLKGRKFKLDCSHHITFCHHLGSDIMIYNDSEVKIICSLCSY